MLLIICISAVLLVFLSLAVTFGIVFARSADLFVLKAAYSLAITFCIAAGISAVALLFVLLTLGPELLRG